MHSSLFEIISSEQSKHFSNIHLHFILLFSFRSIKVSPEEHFFIIFWVLSFIEYPSGISS